MKTMQWVKTSKQKPLEGANVEYSNDGVEIEGTMDYKCNRQCMMAGIAGGHGYFSSLGFATDGEQGEDKNLICDDPEYWRYWDEDDIRHYLTEVAAIEWADKMSPVSRGSDSWSNDKESFIKGANYGFLYKV